MILLTWIKMFFAILFVVLAMAGVATASMKTFDAVKSKTNSEGWACFASFVVLLAPTTLAGAIIAECLSP